MATSTTEGGGPAAVNEEDLQLKKSTKELITIFAEGTKESLVTILDNVNKIEYRHCISEREGELKEKKKILEEEKNSVSAVVNALGNKESVSPFIKDTLDASLKRLDEIEEELTDIAGKLCEMSNGRGEYAEEARAHAETACKISKEKISDIIFGGQPATDREQDTAVAAATIRGGGEKRKSMAAFDVDEDGDTVTDVDGSEKSTGGGGRQALSRLALNANDGGSGERSDAGDASGKGEVSKRRKVNANGGGGGESSDGEEGGEKSTTGGSEEKEPLSTRDALAGQYVVVTKEGDKDCGKVLEVEEGNINGTVKLKERTQLNSKDLPDESIRPRKDCAVIYKKGENDEKVESLVKSRTFGRDGRIRIVEKSGNRYRELKGTGKDGRLQEEDLENLDNLPRIALS